MSCLVLLTRGSGGVAFDRLLSLPLCLPLWCCMILSAQSRVAGPGRTLGSSEAGSGRSVCVEAERESSEVRRGGSCSEFPLASGGSPRRLSGRLFPWRLRTCIGTLRTPSPCKMTWLCCFPVFFLIRMNLCFYTLWLTFPIGPWSTYTSTLFLLHVTLLIHYLPYVLYLPCLILAFFPSTNSPLVLFLSRFSLCVFPFSLTDPFFHFFVLSCLLFILCAHFCIVLLFFLFYVFLNLF